MDGRITGKSGSLRSGSSAGNASSSSRRDAAPTAASSQRASQAARKERPIAPGALPKTPSDAQILAGIAADPDAAPIADAAWFASATLVLPTPKRQTTLRLDADLLDWYRAEGPGWQTRMNAVLRGYMLARAKTKKK